MNFYNVLKYVLMVLFLAIVLVGVFVDGSTGTNQVVTQPQTKFNF